MPMKPCVFSHSWHTGTLGCDAAEPSHRTPPMTLTTARRRDRGFSLLELLVAMMVFAVLATLAYQGISGALRVQVGVTEAQVRWTALVRSSRRRVQGMKARRAQRGQRSGLAPGGRCDGSHGTLAVIARILPHRACEIGE